MGDAIKTPLLFEDAQRIAEEAHGHEAGTGRCLCCTDFIDALMAVDVASREQERYRCAGLHESIAFEDGDDPMAILIRYRDAIRNPETIPAPREGLIGQLNASLGIKPGAQAWKADGEA